MHVLLVKLAGRDRYEPMITGPQNDGIFADREEAQKVADAFNAHNRESKAIVVPLDTLAAAYNPMLPKALTKIADLVTKAHDSGAVNARTKQAVMKIINDALGMKE